MGKKGDLLRAEKAKRVTYTFTAEQLKQHDEATRRAYHEFIKGRMKEEQEQFENETRTRLQKQINDLWNQRAEEFNSGLPEENMTVMLSYLLCISARVLIEKFGWIPIEGHRFTKRNRIVRFCDAVIQTIEDITSDPGKDVKMFAEETFKLYGVRFSMEEDE